MAAANNRHGIILKPQTVKTGLSDIDGVRHVGVPQNSAEPWKSAAGGVARNLRGAELAAVGEALERYSAITKQLPVRRKSELTSENVVPAEEFSLFNTQQIRAADFPFAALYEPDAAFTEVYSVYDNTPHWVPHGLVSLRDDYATGVPTSSGLAAGQSRVAALLRGIQELIERDALMVSWLHSVPGRQVKLSKSYMEELDRKGAEVICLDVTPSYSPHPVAIVAGSLPIRGFKRYSLGSACRETWEEAVEKAFLEWSQGIFFAGYYYSLNPALQFKSYDDVNTFDSHAAYYTVNPKDWDKIPLLKGERYQRTHTEVASGSNAESLEKLVRALKHSKIRLFYRDITARDLIPLGMYTIRAISPDLAPIVSHQRHLFLGGTVKDVLWRYPWAGKYNLIFPNPLPHPLG